MQIKKRYRRPASLHASRSIYQPSASSKNSINLNSHPHPHIPNLPFLPPNQNNLAATRSQNHSTPKIPRKEVRLATENCMPNEGEGFETFQKGEGNRYTLTEKYTTRNHPSREMIKQNEEAEMEDSD